MKKEYFTFTKNMTLSTLAMIVGAMGISKLMENYTDNGKIIGAVSTIAQYLIGYGVFLPLQAGDNRDKYQTKEGKFDRRQFAIDNTKFEAGFLGLDAIYVVTRPFVQDYLMKKGIDAANASAITDTLYLPVYAIAAFGLAKATGVLKTKNNSLEDNL